MKSLFLFSNQMISFKLSPSIIPGEMGAFEWKSKTLMRNKFSIIMGKDLPSSVLHMGLLMLSVRWCQ